MKKTLLRLLFAVLFILPTVISLVYCHHVRTAPPSEKDVTTISIEDTKGKKISYSRITDGEAADSAIKFFYGINKDAEKIDTLPDGVLDGTPYKVVMTTGAKEGEYRYYFTTNADACYYSAPDGTAYKIGPDNAALFLSSEYAACYYDFSVMPKLMLAGTSEVFPKAAEWKYRGYNDVFVKCDTSGKITDKAQPMGNVILSLAFSDVDAPDESTVTVSDGSEEKVFNGLSDPGISQIEGPRSVHVEVKAEWHEDANRAYSGKAEYSFDAEVTPAPKFFESRTDAVNGSFITVTGKNVADASAVTFSSEPDIHFTPQFFADGATVKALVPFALDLEAGTYKLTFTYAGVSSEINVTLLDAGYGANWFGASDELLEKAFSADAVKERDDLVTEMAKIAYPEREFEEEFYGSPNVTAGPQVIRTFGQVCNVNEDPETQYVCLGEDFLYWDVLPVNSLNSGTVVYEGELQYTGKTVVIEHGYGLKTWYCNLEEILVSKDEKVEKGQLIGNCGSTGFADFSSYGNKLYGTHVAMTVGSCFVDPATAQNYGVTFVNVN